MATAQRTTDHEEIRRWVEGRGGQPAIVEGTGGMLRIDFGEPDESLEHVDWDRFFEIFDRSNIAFLYDPKGYMVKFVAAGEGESSGNGRRKRSSGGSRKKSSSARKKSTSGGRKKSSGRKKSTSSSAGSRKKSTGARKKSTSGRKKSSTNGRKKSTSGRKKSSTNGRKKSSTNGRKKSSTNGRKKSSNGRKKSTSGRKKSSGRKYGPKAGRKVERAMHEMKRGELKSGGSGKKVKSRKQAIAIGLSEARSSGGKVPANPNRRGSRRKRG